jgi:AcrR family transcriptional regulator
MYSKHRKPGLRTQIEAAARTVFLRKGYPETKITDIAKEAHVSPSTIYLYYDSKKQLFQSLNIPEAAQLRPHHERRLEQIHRVALHQFAERGFEATTMDDIAREIGFSKAALYQYCSNKEDLFLQVLQQYSHAIPPEEAVAGANCADWKQAIYNIAESFMAISRDPDRAAFMSSVIRESNQFPAFGTAYYEKSFCTARNNVSAFLTRLQQEGTIRADLDIKVAVTSFLGALTSYGILYDTIRGIPREIAPEDFIRTTAETFIRGIEAN